MDVMEGVVTEKKAEELHKIELMLLRKPFDFE